MKSKDKKDQNHSKTKKYSEGEMKNKKKSQRKKTKKGGNCG